MNQMTPETMAQEIFTLAPETMSAIVRLNELFKGFEKLYETTPQCNPEIGNAIISHPEVGADSAGCEVALQALDAVARQGLETFNLFEGMLLQLRGAYLAGLQNLDMFHGLLETDRQHIEDYRKLLAGLEAMRQQVSGESVN